MAGTQDRIYALSNIIGHGVTLIFLSTFMGAADWCSVGSVTLINFRMPNSSPQPKEQQSTIKTNFLHF